MRFYPTITHLLNQSSDDCEEPESCNDDTSACTAQDIGSSSGVDKPNLLSIISFDVASGATYRISLSSYDSTTQASSFKLDVSWITQGGVARRLRALSDEEMSYSYSDPPSLVDFDVDFTVKFYVDETNAAQVQSAIHEKLEYLFAEDKTLTAANGGVYRTNFDVLLSEAATAL